MPNIFPYPKAWTLINWFYSINLNIMLSNWYAKVRCSLDYYSQTMLD